MELDEYLSPIVVLYLFSHLLGLTAALTLYNTQVAQGTAVVNSSPMSGLYLFGIILAATVLMLLLYRYSLGFILKGWFYLAIFFTLLIFFATFLPPGAALGAAVAGFIVRKLTPDIWTRNLVDAMSYAGVGAFFGTMIGVVPAGIFLLLVALYDLFAVNVSEHMVDLVEQGMDTDTFMGLMYPKEGNAVPAGDVSDVDQEDLEQVQVGIVGGGDVVIPMIFAVSLMKQFSPIASSFASIGAGLGLAILLKKAREGTYYPAIPAVGGGAVVGLVVYLGLVSLLSV